VNDFFPTTSSWPQLSLLFLLLNEELHNLFSSPSIHQVKENDMSRACSRHRKKRNVHRYFGWKASRKEATRETKT
jgi:hypothetical protein